MSMTSAPGARTNSGPCPLRGVIRVWPGLAFMLPSLSPFMQVLLSHWVRCGLSCKLCGHILNPCSAGVPSVANPVKPGCFFCERGMFVKREVQGLLEGVGGGRPARRAQPWQESQLPSSPSHLPALGA